MRPVCSPLLRSSPGRVRPPRRALRSRVCGRPQHAGPRGVRRAAPPGAAEAGAGPGRVVRAGQHVQGGAGEGRARARPRDSEVGPVTRPRLKRRWLAHPWPCEPPDPGAGADQARLHAPPPPPPPCTGPAVRGRHGPPGRRPRRHHLPLQPPLLQPRPPRGHPPLPGANIRRAVRRIPQRRGLHAGRGAAEVLVRQALTCVHMDTCMHACTSRQAVLSSRPAMPTPNPCVVSPAGLPTRRAVWGARRGKLLRPVCPAWPTARLRSLRPPSPPPPTHHRDSVVSATLDVYAAASSQLLPTPLKSHYTFNLRDCSRVVQVGACVCVCGRGERGWCRGEGVRMMGGRACVGA